MLLILKKTLAKYLKTIFILKKSEGKYEENYGNIVFVFNNEESSIMDKMIEIEQLTLFQIN
ncbi:hypothetical protein HMPREF1049_1593 [Fusobacterium necrophorum subsp. funduliforme ATCC 51357]|uniref:Uncharacterized protein n=1 Tax=Fusobacterium gonidiaformans 3-1-5R TaxID=469605 RepID=E5BI13_9FUSO|nr:hypothetical protein FSBG_01633 [Fusobacterium gonidiaformans 3-1-5R]EIJ72427.1 hypothetical protein HMPREF1049_1593 [Fusobacterium necrophorum subsp. funduliforme ATCC 51357]KAB0552930.1 hypothetical protein F7P76_06090 [Fusobacterium necrophorum subsp. funduliforme]